MSSHQRCIITPADKMRLVAQLQVCSRIHPPPTHSATAKGWRVDDRYRLSICFQRRVWFVRGSKLTIISVTVWIVTADFKLHISVTCVYLCTLSFGQKWSTGRQTKNFFHGVDNFFLQLFKMLQFSSLFSFRKCKVWFLLYLYLFYISLLDELPFDVPSSVFSLVALTPRFLLTDFLSFSYYCDSALGFSYLLACCADQEKSSVVFFSSHSLR